MYKTFFYLNASSRISEVCQNFHLCFLWFWYNGKTRFIPLFKWYKEMLWRLIDENLQIWSTGVAQPLPRRLKKMLSILKRIFRNFLFFAFRSTENLFFFHYRWLSWLHDPENMILAIRTRLIAKSWHLSKMPKFSITFFLSKKNQQLKKYL